MSLFCWSSMCLSNCLSSTAFHPVAWCREIRSSSEEQLVENRKGWKEGKREEEKKGEKDR